MVETVSEAHDLFPRFSQERCVAMIQAPGLLHIGGAAYFVWPHPPNCGGPAQRHVQVHRRTTVEYPTGADAMIATRLLTLATCCLLLLPPALRAQEQQHWSFRPVVRPVPPAVRQSARVRTPVARFILAALEAKGEATGEGLMTESVRRQLLRLVDQLLTTALAPEERETLLRQMRHLLEPPSTEESHADQPGPRNEGLA